MICSSVDYKIAFRIAVRKELLFLSYLRIYLQYTKAVQNFGASKNFQYVVSFENLSSKHTSTIHDLHDHSSYYTY